MNADVALVLSSFICGILGWHLRGRVAIERVRRMYTMMLDYAQSNCNTVGEFRFLERYSQIVDWYFGRRKE